MSAYRHNVPDLFRNIVDEHRNRAALIWPDCPPVTFGDLDRLGNQVAHFLQQQGISKGDRICIRLEKCTLAYCLMIGSLKIGAPYVMIDPSNPADRVAHILAKCAPKLVFSGASLPPVGSNYHVVRIDTERPFLTFSGATTDSFEPTADILGNDPAYIMFTSGSTGFPKGAVMSHANLLNLVQWARQEFSVTANDVFTNLNPLYFDNSVFDFYASLMNGASLAPFDSATMRDPYLVMQRIHDLRCTIYFSVPSLLIYFQTLKLIAPSVFPNVRVIIFGGEGYPKTKLKELFDCLHPNAECVNVYGPTECTCICSAYRVTEADLADLSGYPPLGGPIPNFSFQILNSQEEAVAPDEVGELYLGGPCVGLGYFNEPELTQIAFRQNPLNQRYYERVYRTGDLVRLSSRDGKVYFVGRKDNQIKHQGYRIELDEIEHALRRIRGIDEAAALHRVRDGISTIVGVVASRDPLTSHAIRNEVAKLLPAYMVPGSIEILDWLPKNANGKIDRVLLQSQYS